MNKDALLTQAKILLVEALVKLDPVWDAELRTRIEEALSEMGAK